MSNQLKNAIFGVTVGIVALTSCSKNDDSNPGDSSGSGERLITLTASFPKDGRAGDGGTLAYAISPENAANPNYEVKMFTKTPDGKYTGGFSLKSERTARVQASQDGKYLYNIQYTGAMGGVFNKYEVAGQGIDKYLEVGHELNTAVILGTSPRWTKAAEGVGIGVYAAAETKYSGDASAYKYDSSVTEVRVAVIDLNNTAITNTAQFTFPFTSAEKKAGYAVSRMDNPVLNQAKTKVYIGCNVSKVDPNGAVTIRNGAPSWPSEVIDGTKTLVLDYPSLRNPTIITSAKAKTNNHSYRTMTQYVGSDGHLYQAATGQGTGSQILRISSATNVYDDTYDFNLNTALNTTGVNIKAWTYVKDNIGVVLYTEAGVDGGRIALVDLNAKTAIKLATENQSETGLSETFGQYQNIGVAGDYVYVPMTPTGKDGNLYVINWRTKEIKKGARLLVDSGCFFIGAY